jgi:hypothetical protein
MGDDGAVNDEIGDLPEAKTDDQDRAPGGADATVLESDTGASLVTGDPDTDLLDDHIGRDDIGAPLAAEQPLSAQQEEEKVPDAIQEPEDPESDEQKTDNTKGEEAPSG